MSKNYVVDEVELERLKILKKSILRYQREPTPEAFARILDETDFLVLATVSKLRSRYKHLRSVELQELYQIGIVGLGQAAMRIRENENPIKIPAWIVGCIKVNVLHVFRYLEREISIHDLSTVTDGEHNLTAEYKRVYAERTVPPQVRRFLFKQELSELRHKRVLTKRGFVVMKKFLLQGKTKAEIAREAGQTPGAVGQVVATALRRIKNYLTSSAMQHDEEASKNDKAVAPFDEA